MKVFDFTENKVTMWIHDARFMAAAKVTPEVAQQVLENVCQRVEFFHHGERHQGVPVSYNEVKGILLFERVRFVAGV